MVDSRVAASGEWGGGLGAVAPAVGEEGPQQVATVLPVDLLLAAVAVAAAGESPTTSISSSSSTISLAAGG